MQLEILNPGRGVLLKHPSGQRAVMAEHKGFSMFLTRCEVQEAAFLRAGMMKWRENVMY